MDTNREPLGVRPQRRRKTFVREDAGVDPVAEVLKGEDRVLGLTRELADLMGQVRGRHKRGATQICGKGDQVLLNPIVQVTLNPSALRVLSVHDALPGFRELVGLDLDELELIGEVCSQAGVAKSKGCLPRQRREEIVIPLIQMAIDLGAAFDHTNKFTRVFQRHYSIGPHGGRRLDPIPSNGLEEDRIAAAPADRNPDPTQVEGRADGRGKSRTELIHIQRRFQRGA